MRNIAFSDYDMNRRSGLVAKLCSKSALTIMVLVTGLILVYWMSLNPTHYQRNIVHDQDLKWLQTLIDSKLLKDEVNGKKDGKLFYPTSTTTPLFESLEDWGEDSSSSTTKEIIESEAIDSMITTTRDQFSLDEILTSTSASFRDLIDSVIGANIDQKSTTTSSHAFTSTELFESSRTTPSNAHVSQKDILSRTNPVDARFNELLNDAPSSLGITNSKFTDRRTAILRQLGFGNSDKHRTGDEAAQPLQRFPATMAHITYSERNRNDNNPYKQDVADITDDNIDDRRAHSKLSEERVTESRNENVIDKGINRRPYQQGVFDIFGRKIGDNKAGDMPYQQRISHLDGKMFGDNGVNTNLHRKYVYNNADRDTEENPINIERDEKPVHNLVDKNIYNGANAPEPFQKNFAGSNAGASENANTDIGKPAEGIQSVVRDNTVKHQTETDTANGNLIEAPVSKIGSQGNETETTVQKQIENPYVLRPLPLHYPEYINVYDWNSKFDTDEATECVPMQTITSFLRVCIHPLHEDGDVSTLLKGRGTWEFTGVRDVQLAVLKLGDDSGLVDLGAGIGAYSLAVASLHRQVIAVEPYFPHVQMFQRSVLFNKLQPYVTLVRNVISDKHERMLIEHLPGHLNDVNISAYEEGLDSSKKSVAQSITLNDLAEVVPFKKIVLKIDIPRFVQAALKQSTVFFNKLDVKYVFMHWNSNDKQLCQYVLSYFIGKYTPALELHGKALDVRQAFEWPYTSIVWVKK